MDLKKVFDQTVREIKREVNKKVLKVPEIEQKVLDATSNEPWGPHGTLMAEIAQATRNYNEHQMVMGILWKRLNDSGRNWRHVYKALTVLEFLVANGAERVIDDLREHSYQVQTLIDFQYVEPNGKDQGVNVRKKAQTLVGLINDKEKIREVRQKAAANRDKYKGMSSTGGMYKSSSYSSTEGSYGGDRYDHDDDHYRGGSRYGGRDDDRYGSSGDQDSDRFRDEDRYTRDSDRYGRHGAHYRDDDFESDRGLNEERFGSKTVDRYSENYSSNTRDRDKDRRYDDDDRDAEHLPEHGKSNAPPSYEELYTGSDSPHARPEESSGHANTAARGPKASSQLQVPPIVGHSTAGKSASGASVASSKVIEDFADFDDFDPRASAVTHVAPPPSFQQDLFGKSELQAAPMALPKYETNVADLFGQSSFQASFPSAAPGGSGSSANSEKKLDFFESSSVNASNSGSSNFFDPGNAFPPPSSLTSLPGNDFTAFASAPVNSTTVSSTSFSAFPLSAANSIAGPSTDFSSFSSVPSAHATQAGSGFLGDSSFNALGSQTTGNNLNSTAAVSANQPYSVTTTVNPPKVPPEVQTNIFKPTKDKFELKSSVWADHLSSGLLDLNLGKPRSNPLAELGIHLDSSFTVVEKKKEVVSAPGRAMGSGSGLGIAGASILNPPPPPPMMGGQMGLGVPGSVLGMSPGIGATPGIGYGVTQGMAMNPGIGMSPGFGMNTNPGMMQGTHPNSAMGMGMNPSYGMGVNPSYGTGMGVGGYSNQQQQYGGFR